MNVAGKDAETIMGEVVNANRADEKFVRELYTFDPGLFSNLVIVLIRMISESSEVNFDTLTQLHPLKSLPLFVNYMSIPESTEKRKQEYNILRYIQCLKNAFTFKEEAMGTFNKLIQLLNMKATFQFNQVYDGPSRVKVNIKFPKPRQPKLETVSSTIQGMLNSSIQTNKQNIIDTETDKQSFSPGTSRVVSNEPLLPMIIECAVSYQEFMKRDARDNNILLSNWLDIEPVEKNENTRLKKRQRG